MSSLALSRLGSLSNSASTYVVLAAGNRLKPKPMIAIPDDHHHHDHHMSLPNAFVPSTSKSFSKLLINGNLRVSNAFTSNWS
jgi:hypothetical protein